MRAGELPVIATYDEQDRLKTYGPNTYAYTDAGALLSKTNTSGTTSYVYDALGAGAEGRRLLLVMTGSHGDKLAHLVLRRDQPFFGGAVHCGARPASRTAPPRA